MPQAPTRSPRVSGGSIATRSASSWNEVLGRLDREEVPARAAAHWDAHPGSLAWIGSGSNLVYRFECRGLGRYLKIIHAELRGPDEVAATLAFQERLASGGAPVCRPLRTRSGRLLAQGAHEGERWVASAVEEVEGAPVRSRSARSPAWLAIGRAIGALHRVAADPARTPEAGLRHWRDEWRHAREWLDPADGVAQRELARLSRWLERLPPGDSNLVPTHGDLNLGNLLWADGRISVIDFDEPVLHWPGADLARPMRDLLGLPRETRRRILAALVRGYRGERPLEERWISELPYFLRLKELEIYAWLESGQRWSSSDVPGGTRSEIRAEIHARMRAPLEW
ncbi:MAG: phosphotransferase enzyme family protein [Myxococcota bacterium]